MAIDLRRRHGVRTTFVRVADVPLGGGEPRWPPAAGEVRIVGTPSGRKAAIDRAREVASQAGVSLTHLATRSLVTDRPYRSTSIVEKSNNHPQCAWSKPCVGECGSPGCSLYAWCLMWLATQSIARPSAAIEPKTSKTASMSGDVSKLRCASSR